MPESSLGAIGMLASVNKKKNFGTSLNNNYNNNNNKPKMAKDVLMGFWLMTVLALVVVDSGSEVTMLDRFESVERCGVMCTTAFADSRASFVALVCRPGRE